MESSIELVRTAAENKHISLFADFTQDVVVKADKNMLSTVLRNLLSNAIKFTPGGGSVTVSCKSSNGRAVLSVWILVLDWIRTNFPDYSKLMKP
ncbi:MAG: HAMP domain-containing histidine kinase [Bacteroidales bacterium]|nr:HAMP domain-containing histidine kinase [Bacteroidales bacterium]